MAKILAIDIRVGNLLEWDKRLWRVLKCYHVHVGGRGGAYMQVEMKDIEKNTKVNQRFIADEKVEKAFVEVREMNFLYNEGDNYIFMDNMTFEQVELTKEFLDTQADYLLPNTQVQINFYHERAIGIELPQTIALTVIEADPNIKGASVTTSFKTAILETGLQVQVPPFIEKGEKIKINTDTGQYMERA